LRGRQSKSRAAFEWCAFAAGWLALRAADSTRDAAFLEDRASLDGPSLFAYAAQIDLVRKRTIPEVMLFLVPFAGLRFASATRDGVESLLDGSAVSEGRRINAFARPFAFAASFACAISETYQAFVFFAACASFRVACGIALLRLNAFLTRFDSWSGITNTSASENPSTFPSSGTPPRASPEVAARPRVSWSEVSGSLRPDSNSEASSEKPSDGSPRSRRTSHSWTERSVQSDHHRVVIAQRDLLAFFLKRIGKRFRFFLAATLASAFAETTFSCLGASAVFKGKRGTGEKNAAALLFETVLDPRAIGVVARVACVALNIRAAAIVTHRLQRVVGFASRRHADLTLIELETNSNVASRKNENEVDWAFAYRARSAILGVLRDQPLRISVYGFAWDRDFFRGLHMVVFATGLFVVTRALVA
jgi:hypothetical protein